MSLPHALLTALLEKPCTGAELARRFDKSIGHFWQASHQQIYRELARMEEQQLIVAHGLATARGSQRRFVVLPAGRQELERWSRLEVAPVPMRDPLQVRLRAAAILGTLNMEGEIRRHQRLHKDLLAQYREILVHDFPSDQVRGTSQELQLAILRAGIALEQAWLLWCEQTLESLARTGEARPGEPRPAQVGTAEP